MRARVTAALLPLALAACYFAATASAASPVVTIIYAGPNPVPSGTIINYTVTVDDPEDDPDPSASCIPASGFTATVDTTIECSATDSESNVGTASLIINVTPPDTTGPVLTLPGPITAQATSPAGAVVTYSVSGSDAVDGPVAVSCSPPSGSTFGLGSNTVTCTATDSSGNPQQAPNTFTVTVVDTVAPTLALPGGITVSGTGPTAVTYSPAPSATDAVDPSVPVSCAPPSGSSFPFGTTTVNCSATDDSGNEGTGSFSVTVQDPDAPVVTVPASRTVEATGPAGAVVTYTAATAVDNKDGPVIPTCTKASGTTFPLGTTTVTCSATDSDGKTGTASFTITVRDTTKPILRVPGELAIKSAAPVAASAQAVQSWFAGVNASDLVDPKPSVVVSLPSTFPLGTTSVPVVATDASNNKASAIVRVTVAAEQGVAPTSTQTPDLAAPGNVVGIKAKLGNRSVSLSWKAPAADDFDRVEITRAPGKGGGEQSIVYTGPKTQFKDSGLAVGTEYRYLIVSVDKAGNRSTGVSVVLVGKAQLLLRPAEGAKVTRPPLLVWAKAKNASYYNVQVYKGKGKKSVKVFTFWPKQPRLKMPARWTYEGKTYKFSAGVYLWYVFPGFGNLADAKYGDMLGQSKFTVAKK